MTHLVISTERWPHVLTDRVTENEIDGEIHGEIGT